MGPRKCQQQESLANSYRSNIGLIARSRGEIGRARELYIQAYILFAEIGGWPQVDMVQRLLDSLPRQVHVPEQDLDVPLTRLARSTQPRFTQS